MVVVVAVVWLTGRTDAHDASTTGAQNQRGKQHRMNRTQFLAEAKRQGIAITPATMDHVLASVHEVGHSVCAVVLGARLHRAVLGDDPRAECHDLPEAAQAPVSYAGPWSEARWRAGRPPNLREMHSALPRCSSDYKALIAAGGPEAGRGAIALLERCWPAVEMLAGKLFRDGQIGHRDVCAALGLSDDGGPGSFELACIRSGLRGRVGPSTQQRTQLS